MNDRQTGWDSAEYTCGRCWTTVTATTEDDFIQALRDHRDACPGAPRETPR